MTSQQEQNCQGHEQGCPKHANSIKEVSPNAALPESDAARIDYSLMSRGGVQFLHGSRGQSDCPV